MDPYTALGAASAIIQFVQFGGTVLGKAYVIHKAVDGSSPEIQELEKAISRMRALSSQFDSMAKDKDALSFVYEKEAWKLAVDCEDLAKKMLDLLREFDLQGPPTKVKSVQLALKLERRQPALASLQRHLSQAQRDGTNFLVRVLFDRQSSFSQKLDNLAHLDGVMNINIATKADELRQSIQTALNRQDRLQESIDWIAKRVASLADETKHADYGQRILYSLRYDRMRSRQNAVADSYADTYEWIFKSGRASDSGGQAAPVGFMEWLRSGEGIFWISGKAGSGKSTLMKVLCSHRATQSALGEWAGDAKLIVAQHFFWLAGHTMQKSRIGLLRVLLFEVFKQCPELMPILCKEIWNRPNGPEDDSELWTLPSLSCTLNRLHAQRLKVNGRALRLCFFIDGLDEYKGEHRELLNMISNLAKSPDIKICVSSRPWNTFEKALGRGPSKMLTLQDHTRNDIRAYVQGHLVEDEHFAHMASQGTSCEQVVTEVTEKAQGVFLWVYLVVKLLLRGLDNGDSLEDLQRRLRQLPPDLEDYFQQMFDTLDEFYQERTAQTFLVCLAAEGPLPLLGFAALEPHDILAQRICSEVHVKLSDVLSLQAQLKKRINACCRDLIEVNPEHNDTMVNETYVVDFLHRTVRDFLHTSDTTDLLRARAGDDFRQNQALCDMSLTTAKRTQSLRSGAGPRLDFFKEQVLCVALYARRLEAEERKTPADTLDDLRDYLAQLRSTWSQALLAQQNPSQWVDQLDTFDLFVCFCAKQHLVIYLQYLLAQRPRLFETELGHLSLAAILGFFPQDEDNGNDADRTHDDDNVAIDRRRDSVSNVNGYNTRPAGDEHDLDAGSIADTVAHAGKTIKFLSANGVDINQQAPHRLCAALRLSGDRPIRVADTCTFWEWYLHVLDRRCVRVRLQQERYAHLTETLLTVGPHDTCSAYEQKVLRSCFKGPYIERLLELRQGMARQRSNGGFFRWSYGWLQGGLWPVGGGGPR